MKQGTLAGIAIVLAWIAGCRENKDRPPPDGDELGSQVAGPGASLGGRVPTPGELALADPHSNGRAPEVHVTGVFLGRLVDLHDEEQPNGDRRLRARDFVIGAAIPPEVAGEVALEVDPVTQRTRVTILHPGTSAAYRAVRTRLERALRAVAPRAHEDLVEFTVVPRNAALVVRTDDLLDANTISGLSVLVETGEPPASHFAARVFPDASHGAFVDADGDGVAEFHSTRIVVDLTVSPVESDGSLPINLVGLPAALDAEVANARLRLPTRSALGLEAVANLAGNGLATTGNGPVDLASPTADVVRAFRSGGAFDLTADPFGGFLPDLAPPRVVGRMEGLIASILPAPATGVADYVLDFVFGRVGCAAAPRPGDVLQSGAVFLLVKGHGPAPMGPTVTGLAVRVIEGDAATLALGPARFHQTFDPALDAGRAACFLELTPGPPPGGPPTVDVPTAAQVFLSFSEPLDADSLASLESLRLTRTADPSSPFDQVVAQTFVDPADPRKVVVAPVTPFAHQQGTDESYFFEMLTGADGPRDLAGNPLVAPLPQVELRIDPAEATQTNGGFVLQFESADEDGDGLPELRGQLKTRAGTLVAREVARFSGIVDRTQTLPGRMVALPGGVQTPLSPLGSRLHAIWRYPDAGFTLLDDAYHNLDVEGLAWSPAAGSVVSDAFGQFEIALSHTRFLPDEWLDPSTLFPLYPASGLMKTFAENRLDRSADPGTVVHPRELGYELSPLDVFAAATGTLMMPYPLNRSVPAEDFRYYTWRDTALEGLGAPNGLGADPVSLVNAGEGMGSVFDQNEVPAIGLPLLMEFRTFPDEGAAGLNALDVSIAVNSSSLPNFRAFSTGGVNTSGNVILVDPDLATTATGTFGPSGGPTLPTDGVVYMGQMDLVIRVSRSQTRWFDTGLESPLFLNPVLAEVLPEGTGLVLAYRGASSVTGGPELDANMLDPHGNVYPGSGSVDFLGGNAWKDDPTAVDGARFLQVRISAIANVLSGDTPSLGAAGFAFDAP